MGASEPLAGSDAAKTYANPVLYVGDFNGPRDARPIGVVGRWVRDRAYYERARWAGRRELDGAVVMDGALTNPLAHSVEAALSIAGATRTDDVAEVEIDAWHAHDIEADDTTSAVITTSGGIRIGVGLTLCSADPRPPTVTVYGSHGLIRLRYEHDSVDVVTDAGTVTTVHPRRSLLANLAEHLDTGAELLAPIGSTGAFMRVLEASRVGEPPAPVPDGFVTWIGDGAQAHPEIDDVDEWCERAGRAGATFTALGAPWTAGRSAD